MEHLKTLKTDNPHVDVEVISFNQTGETFYQVMVVDTQTGRELFSKIENYHQEALIKAIEWKESVNFLLKGK